MSTLKYFIGCVAVASFLSCNKDESFDVKGDPDTVFFTNSESLGNMPVNSASYTVVNIPDGAGWANLSSTLPASIKLPVFATKPVSQDVTISAQLDNTLVASYNAANNTAYKELPAGILNTQSLTARIAQGATTSVDSLSIAVDPANLKTLTEKAYMAPIKLTTVSNGSVGKITSNTAIQAVYVVLNTELRQIRFLATAADVTGSLQSRTGWSVGFTPAPATNGSVTDGLTTTFTRWGTTPGQVDIDMLSSRAVTGLRLYTTTTAAQLPTQVEVYTSVDGINYDLIGSPLRANLTFATPYNYVLFYRAIQARYIRLRISYSTSTNTQNTRLTELDVYAN
ncbi:DUF1735 domain-containing protein [Terrimonas sp. NA20]|uniref:DUF1735 domain-containing protein n=1 Tax=Terrimonas ginsenosidimutans TaxID=2908004 RepID=A0ABS9KLZ2_9BACT|nr:DUF1735 domain-containing protein [Terrimonas ginsenosidimutans]MCG2613336.1 DUF1735 domain-containing protein [Terrimonas ginsenosidimutans]